MRHQNTAHLDARCKQPELLDLLVGIVSSVQKRNVNFPAGATVVINVSGTAGGATPNAGFNVNGSGANGDSTTTDVKNVIFNYYQATTPDNRGRVPWNGTCASK